MDSKLALVTEQEGDGFYVAQFKTSELAIFSYYVQSNKESFLIDPVFDVTTYTELINKRASTLKFVALTHYHADYLSGHTEFKVPIVMGANSTRAVNSFKVKECADGEEVAIGAVSVKVIHTPGHTPESSCYLLKDASGKDAAIFTGDTVFLGEVGRPDLACGENITSQDLAGMLYDSIQKLKTLDGAIRLYPGHGSGSACGKAIGAGNFCTLGAQHGTNYGFTFEHKADFVTALTANIPKPPKYFFYDAGLNQKGASSYENAYSHSHRALTLEEFLKHSSTAKIVDTRVNIGQGIIKGSYWLPSAGPIANWISNFIAPEEQFLLICEQGKEKDIIDRFFRIGFFKIIGYNGFNVSQLKEEFIKPNVLKFGTVNEVQDRVHLDVRSLPEYQNLGIVEGAILIPLPQLQSRVAELKDKKNIVINCLTGGRAKVAFSVLARNGIPSNIIVEDFNNFKNNGFNVIPYQK